MKRGESILDYPWPHQPVRLSDEEALVDAGLNLYERGARFRRACEQELRSFGVSFPLWWVLRVTDRLIREVNAEVSQLDVGRRMPLCKSAVSYVMRGLRDRQLIEREPDEWGLADCILLTPRGERLLAAAAGAIVPVARRALSERGP